MTLLERFITRIDILQRSESIFCCLTLKAPTYFYTKMSQLALSDSFECVCYGSTAIINVFILTVRGSTLDVRF